MDNFVPFEGISSVASSIGKQRNWSGTDHARLKEFDLSNMLLLPTHESKRVAETGIARGFGMTGNTADLQQTLYACIRVRRLDRAAALVRRMGKVYVSNAPELLDAHNQYLVGLLEEFLLAPNKEKYTALSKWVELDIRRQNIPLTGPILAVMIKATLHIMDGTRLERTLRRYISYADEAGVEVDTLSSSIFTETEINRILRMMPERYERPAEPLVANEEELENSTQPLEENRTLGDAGAVNFPKIRPHAQKGLGLTALQTSLESLDSGDKLDASSELSDEDLRAQQTRLEADVLDSALKRWREEADITKEMRSRGRLSDPTLGTHVHEWIKELVALVEKDKATVEVSEQGFVQADDVPLLTLAPLLRIMSSEKLCAAAVLGYVGMVGTKKDLDKHSDKDLGEQKPLTATVRLLGEKIALEMSAEMHRADNRRKLNNLPSSERRKKLARLARQPAARSKARMSTTPQDDDTMPAFEFTVPIKTVLGAYFTSLLIKVAKLPTTIEDPKTGAKFTRVQPVITQATHWRNGKKISMLKTSTDFLRKLRKEPVGSFISKSLPMLVEPQKWTSIDSSPYLATPMEAIRFKDRSRSQKEYIKLASKVGNMDQIFEGLNVIGKVPWRINNPVLRVLTHFWNSGEGIAGLAPEEAQHEIPPEPQSKDPADRYAWRRKIQRIENEIEAEHSRRCYQNFQLEIARTYRNNAFYCPHSIDFRGRAYPIPPYFNHMGADYVRGLFVFAKGKELGEHGLYWLKIHLANMYGYDKQSLTERAQFAMDHISDVYDSATNPIDGKRWWLTSDDPWQTLAACMELKAALDSPVPEQYVSHLPVQQDGTCNGLQHYAALGGDNVGARQVNLIPGDKPADIYTAIAEMVKEEVAKDAEKGLHVAQVVNGYIVRKVVKQTVMTNVYGVTVHGARAQVFKQLLDTLPKAVLDSEDVQPVANYVAALIFDALNAMFNGAQAIQVWLGECGSRIVSAITPEQILRIQGRRNGEVYEETKYKPTLLSAYARSVAKEDYQFKSTIVWTTPLGLPVVQPYRKHSSTIIKTNLHNLRLQQSSLSDPVEKRKQLQAFPPNFIHSLDATHMMLSALKCDEIGVQFASVHDSFWTHAADVPTMNRVLRDAFVRMHSEDIVGRLRQEFIARYAGCYRYAPIHKHSVLGQKVSAMRKAKGLSSRQFMRGIPENMDPINELVEEYERVQMLQSSDPEIQAKGQAMITPGSIVEGLGPEVLKEAIMAHVNLTSPPLLGSKDTAPSSDDEDVVSIPGIEYDADSADAESDPIETSEGEGPVEEAEDLTNQEQNDDMETLSEQPKRKKSVPRRGEVLKIYIWLPIEFPEAPAKGDFDVAKLKESQYFFS